MAYPNKLWVWGYVAPDRVPTSSIAFVKRSVWCSMESGAEYLQARRAVFMAPAVLPSRDRKNRRSLL